jgi:hypothetical protein
MSFVYCHVNLINEKKYFGISDYSPEKRWNNGEGYLGSFFYEKGILNFGWDNFEHLILVEDVSKELAEQIEARLIKEFETTNADKGYNQSTGAIIKNNPQAEILVENINKRFFKIKKEEIPYIAYHHCPNTYDINFINNLFARGKINTELDCQRNYVWTEDRQQGMWDTLILGHRIPEFHAIREGNTFSIIDGKQRLTTILKIVNNEIPLEKRYASEKIKVLFKNTNKTSLFFNELPEILKQRIEETKISFAEYSNLTEEDLIELFRKLNASMSLNDFSKGISQNIHLRVNFSRFLLHHPVIQKIFTDKQKGKSDDECSLVRTLLLLKYGIGEVELLPNKMERYYFDLTTKDLKNGLTQIEEALGKISPFQEELFNFKAKMSYFPIFLYYIIKNHPSEEQIKKLFTVALPKIGGVRGENFDKKTSLKRYNTVLKELND